MSKEVTNKEKIENFLVRQGHRRSDHKVTPGLYALGNPSRDSEVFVTANYKISVDALRQAIEMDCWVLVLDTHGINVWCAAGKGTFGTAELIRMIAKCRLNRILGHKRLILPQLGAPGVSAYQVKQKTGFDVVYGPVRADDVEDFVQADYQASRQMRQVTFNFKERMILTPLEFIQSFKFVGPALAVLIILGLLSKYGSGNLLDMAVHAVVLISASITGTLIFPAILPVFRTRSFTVKAIPVALLWSLFSYIFMTGKGISGFEALGTVIMGAVLIELFALNFTGATPITSYTETKEETLKVIPYFIGTYALGLIVFSLSIWQVI